MFGKDDIPEDFLEAVRKSSDLFLHLQVGLDLFYTRFLLLIKNCTNLRDLNFFIC